MIAPEGWPFVLAPLALAAAVFLLLPRWMPAGVLLAIVAAFCAWFFRNPERHPPQGAGVVVSPADGKIVFAGDVPPGLYNPEPGKRVSVFMNVFDVHVNRAPVSGTVVSVRYNPGKFLVASVEKASLENEQNAVLLETADGKRVGYVQIAGLIARRIVCDLAPGQAVRQGQRVGMIRFGSRVDVLLPASAALKVRPGDRVTAGESIVGVLP